MTTLEQALEGARTQTRAALDDVSALGPIAPLRAAYEGSKRLGGHDIVFGWLARRPAPRRLEFVVPRGLACPRSVPAEAERRAIADAMAICEGRAPIFGVEVDLLALGTGRRDPQTGLPWPREPWWHIDIRSDARQGDVKWVWEVGRLRHLVVLARAARVDPSGPWAEVLIAALSAWLEEHPPERGIQWYSNLELALRALAFVEILSTAGGVVPGTTRDAVAQNLWSTGRHLMADLPYTVSSMRNNHLLGDGLGLVVVGRCFPGSPTAQRWDRVGEALLRRQLRRHARPDGSMVEDSVSYHRFVLEMLAQRVRLGDAPAEVVDALRRGGEYLLRLGVGVGPVPQYGDWDAGRVCTTSTSAEGVLGSARLAVALTADGARAAWRAEHDECAWYAPEGGARDEVRAVTSGGPVGGGLARAERGPWTVWLKAGGGPSHGHADLCSVAVQHRDEWVVVDPGTGTYNGDLDIRNGLRTSSAHSCLRLSGEDQLVPHRAFRWRFAATGQVGAPASLRNGSVLMWGWHDAYRRLPLRRDVARTVVVATSGVVVADWVEGEPGLAFDLTVPLHPTWTAQSGRLASRMGALRVELPGRVDGVRGRRRPFAGWFSPTYGALEEASWLQCSGRVEGPVVWSLGELSGRVEGAGLTVGQVRLAVEWRPDRVVLRVDDDGVERTRTLRRAR